MSDQRGNKLIKGAAVLGVAGVVIKLLGAVFRIPLTNWIGDDGMAYYGFAYSIYGALLVLSTAGVPVAVSRLVSENIAVGAYKNAHKVFKMATLLLAMIGLVSFAICYFGGDWITAKLGNADAAMAVKAISPALLIVPIFSAFRGYFNGRQNMNPTAISEITEQLVRVIVGLALAWKLLHVGLKEAAAGASFGASAGSLAGLAVIFLIYLLNRKTIHRKIDLNNQEVEEASVIMKNIVKIAVPIIIGCEIMPIMTLIDTAIIMNRLQDTGWSYEQANSLYGLFSGFCNSLIAFPQVFTQAVAVSLVPAVAACYKLRDKGGIKSNIKLGYRTTMIMAFPCAFGIFALAEPILLLLYPKQPESAHEAVPILMIMAISIIFLAITQTSTGVLQSIDRQMVPVKHLALGCVGKVVVTFVLVGIPAINVKGAAWGTMFAYCVALVLNNRSVRKYTNTQIDYKLTYAKPCVAAMIMGVVVYVVHKGLASFLDTGYAQTSLATLLAILIGMVVYVALIFALKAITMEELQTMPGGNKLARLLRKVIKNA